MPETPKLIQVTLIPNSFTSFVDQLASGGEVDLMFLPREHGFSEVTLVDTQNRLQIVLRDDGTWTGHMEV